MNRTSALLLVALLHAGCADETVSRLPVTDTGPTDVGETPTTDGGEIGRDGEEPDEGPADDTSASGDTAPRTTVAIATFNVSRFFDTVCHTNDCDGGFESAPSQAAFEFKASLIAGVIESMDLDIALLQEVETLDCLEELERQLPEEYETTVFAETGFAGSLDVAVVARGRLLRVREYRNSNPLRRPDGSRTSFAREFLEVHVETPGGRAIVFDSHFKSRNNDDAGRRLAEAQAAREIVLEVAAEYPDALVVLGGDLNDTPGTDAIDALEGDGGLFRVASTLPEGEDGTHEYRGVRNALDHLYLATDAAGGAVPDTVAVVRDASGGLGGSDHAALRAEFEF